ncbi:CHY zinc finger domain protein [Metarhizium album ARSEF 1941]|uniref:CHY zinc finger domain protein n=1 Tax=Metarhizium album (strain ARSEF 1941) TaxID=1081103 RepID=A0A0B2X7U8_METAS|nr:CHY zinc finger domain protein [Metarhizium album ARSEF 1941]KHO01818.1 CHY zinc finger domain protein [Metarhizium album ARSEF 1941]
MIALGSQTDGSQTLKQAVGEAPSSRVVAKPVPTSQADDPRGYQVEQLRRRFSPNESTTDAGTTSLVFKLKPSDPDFPFELTHLECDVRVPANYPDERPELRVKNSNIPWGFRINIERGWDRLAMERKGATILSIVNALDKNLEKFLSEEKADTVKLVAFKDARHPDAAASVTKPEPSFAPTKPVSITPSARPHMPEESYSKRQIAEAKARRAQEVRQLEARMGRLPGFRRSADGIVFTLPIEPKRRNELPPGLGPVNSLHLIVPLLYPLQDVRIQLNEVNDVEAEALEALFAVKAAEQKSMSLMSHVNYLVQNLHALAKQAQVMAQRAAAQEQEEAGKATTIDEETFVTGPSGVSVTGKDGSHIKVIARPPEWDSAGYDDEDSDSTWDGDGGVALLREADAEPDPAPAQVSQARERGTMMSLPSVELHGVEVLQVSILGISVKCERCKTVNDMTGLKPGMDKTTSCKKCGTTLTARFNQTLIHEGSTRAGFIDLSGCKVADMLPSTLIPTCARCSTASQGLVSVRGESVTNVCRSCHGMFTFKIPQVKFVFISPGSPAPATTAAGARRRTEKLGLHAGEALPDQGACAHYRKSFRWFRFSCCNRVHACDKCHDDAEDHVNEWAKRMICGWCSREQKYMAEACGFCGRSVIGRKGKGFWEGGKGTRDQRTMSRKDPRKYKRLGDVN